MQRRVVLVAGVAYLGDRAAAAQARDPQELWQRLAAGGAILFMRHAQTEPGAGDPPGFSLDDCATQRNLDERGRAQARGWGEALRARGITFGRVLTSAWCRCRETAALIDVGAVEHLPALNSFFGDAASRGQQTEALRAYLADWAGPANLLLVSHQVNVTALTGIHPSSGEAVVLDSSQHLDVLGRLTATA